MALASDIVREGFVDFEVKSIPKVCQTYYKIIGDLKPGTRHSSHYTEAQE